MEKVGLSTAGIRGKSGDRLIEPHAFPLSRAIRALLFPDVTKSVRLGREVPQSRGLLGNESMTIRPDKVRGKPDQNPCRPDTGSGRQAKADAKGQ
jgi:hypothetical protein